MNQNWAHILARRSGLVISLLAIAVAGWASPRTNGRNQQPSAESTVSLPAAPAAMQSAAPTAPCPVPATAAATRTWKGGVAEYNAYVAATKLSGAAAAQAWASFVQTYPNSDYLVPALSSEMSAQAAAKEPEKAVATAQTILKSPQADADTDASAFSVMAYYLPNLIGALPPDSPKAADYLQQLEWASQCGAQALSSAQPTQGQNPQQFDQEKAQAAYVFNLGEGFAALQSKNYPSAISDLQSAVQYNSKNAQAYYWLGDAYLSSTPKDYQNGIFYMARASALAPQATAIGNYLNTVYNDFHGSADGLDQIKQTAAANATPPAGFHIESVTDVSAANIAKIKQENEAIEAHNEQLLATADSFDGIEYRLQHPDMAPAQWTKMKGQGYELQGTVVAATRRTVDVAVSAAAMQNNHADVHVVLAVPVSARREPQPGEKVTIDGVASEYRTTPDFQLTLIKGSVKPGAASGA